MRDIYNVLSEKGDLIQIIVEIALNSMGDVQIELYECLDRMIIYDWILEKLLSEIFLNFLLSRNPAHIPAAKVSKYRLVQNIHSRCQSMRSVSNETIRRLEKFVNEGPFYQKPITAVADESQ